MIAAIVIALIAVLGLVMGLAGFYLHEKRAGMDEHERELFL